MLTIKADKDGVKLYAHIKTRLPYLSYEAFQKTLRLKKIAVNGQVASKDRLLSKGDAVEIRMSEQALGRYRFPKVDVVYEDDNIIVVNKPQGVEVDGHRGHAGLTSWLRAQVAGDENAPYPIACHRLETQTGGLVLYARDQAAYNEMLKAFKLGLVHRQYACLVRGFPSPRLGEINLPLIRDARSSGLRICAQGTRGALTAVTRYRVATTIGRLSVLEVNPVTGHPHQLRVHLASIGHPVLGDDRYGDRALNKKLDIKREQLVASALGFEMPEKSSLAYLSDVNITIPTPDFNIRRISFG